MNPPSTEPNDVLGRLRARITETIGTADQADQQDLDHASAVMSEGAPESDTPTGQVVPAVGRQVIDMNGESLRVRDMARSDFSEPPHEPRTLALDVVADDVAGHWLFEVAWPEPDDEATSVYRVILSDGVPNQSECDKVENTLDVVMGLSTSDGSNTNPPTAAIRFYEVWRYRGTTSADAIKKAPYLYAEGHLVIPPMRVEASVDQSAVVVRWEGSPDATYRWVRQTPREARTRRPRPTEGHATETVGFTDSTAVAGERYKYLIYAGAEGPSGPEWSEPAPAIVSVPADLRPVEDLRADQNGLNGQLDLIWTTPGSGSVSIYRSSQPPNAEIHAAGRIPEADLESDVYGLKSEDLLPNAPATRGDQSFITLPAPTGAETHFTPVTIHDGWAVPGRTFSHIAVQPSSEMLVHDRVDWVLVVFAWPEGASHARLYMTQRGVTLDPAKHQPMASMTFEEHRTLGGFRLSRAELPAGDRTLHLVGFRRHQSQDYYSQAIAADTVLPVLARYQVERRRTMFGKTELTLRVVADSETPEVRLALVAAPRFPLSMDDTEARVLARLQIPLTRDEQELDLSKVLTAELPQSGFLRLIVDPAKNIALIDPSVSELRLS